MLGGAVLGVASSAYSAHPVSRDELIGLIREHDAEESATSPVSGSGRWRSRAVAG